MSTSQAGVSWRERRQQSRGYWESRRGRALVAAQTTCLTQALASRREHYGLELTSGATLLGGKAPDSVASSHLAHLVQWAPARDCAEQDATLICPAGALALPDACMGVTLLHHLLEEAPEPHRTLAEAARVTTDDGVLVIFGFHPLGPTRLEHCLGQARYRYPGNGAWQSPARLRDWLTFVDFEVESVNYCGFRAPGTTACRRRGEALGQRLNLPWGTSYMMLARRRCRHAPVQRLRFGWRLPVASRPLGATRLQPVPDDRDTRKRKPD
ncbi:class I SAM-dependent methyltransferase [Vreelandella jeotgali]|uniref:class I SAM-dependent methyltransferase n=1 Tax=Vreelandella jeotgali TaxID=553386 RepID=UPI0003621CA0|nr:methyltransferase domain-containing protein [Halomonas jeotgali]